MMGRWDSQYAYQRRKREWLQAYKMESGCVDCGYNEHPAALDFDHTVEPRNGAPSLAAVARFSWDRMTKEVEKCEVVCANCHRIRTADRRAEAC